MARTKKHLWRRTFVPLAMLLMAWAVGLFIFVECIPAHMPGNNVAVQADAIVVLTGGRGRVDRGTELLATGAGRRMLISGVGGNVATGDLIASGHLTTDKLDCCVTLGRAARNTRENALEAAGWLSGKEAMRLRLVTADFHMPRSLLEFRARLPQATIMPEPVTSENVRLDQWWRWPGTALLLVREYNKYLAARTRLFATRILNWT